VLTDLQAFYYSLLITLRLQLLEMNLQPRLSALFLQGFVWRLSAHSLQISRAV
jgi:hypothetical protein